MNRRVTRFQEQSGQVIITGVIMLLVLLLLLVSIFDVHNVIRAKFKFETAQQSAALAGANWQKNTLNLIGEINLLKACAVMLEGEKNWDIPLPPAEDDDGIARRMAIQGRLDQLTEMQTRVSFIGPIIGYAAAQQAAKGERPGVQRREHLPQLVFRHLITILSRLPPYRVAPHAFGFVSDCLPLGSAPKNHPLLHPPLQDKRSKRSKAAPNTKLQAKA